MCEKNRREQWSERAKTNTKIGKETKIKVYFKLFFKLLLNEAIGN